MNEESHVIELWAEASVVSCDSCREYRDFEPKLPQQRSETSVQLIAVAAPTVPNYFLVKQSLIQSYPPSKVYVQILKRDRE